MKKLTTISITVLSIVTLLFIAQPAQASEGNLEANQGTKLKRVTRSVKTFDVVNGFNAGFNAVGDFIGKLFG